MGLLEIVVLGVLLVWLVAWQLCRAAAREDERERRELWGRLHR